MRRALALLAVSLVWMSVAAAAAPRIAVDLGTYTYPTTVAGIAVTHDFVLSNIGDQDLVIGTVRTTCHCTTTQLATNRLGPGQSVSLHAVFDTTEFVGVNTRREITVPSNDPFTPNLVLTLTGTLVRREVYHNPVSGFLNQAGIILDVRDSASYAAGHLLGAMNVPADQAASYAASLPPGAPLICYGQDGGTAAAATAALKAGGIVVVHAVCDGIGTWGQRSPWVALLVAGADASWGQFLDVSGARGNYANSAASCTVLSIDSDYYVLIDLRSAAAFAAGHLAGAVNMQETSAMSFVNALPDNVRVVLYSDDGLASDRVADTLSQRRNFVTSLLGGLAEWQRQQGSFLVVASAS